jgi:uncharacterized protein (DUF924 family)
MSHTTIEDILQFWFGGDPDGADAGALVPRWFGRDPGFDAQIETRFGATVDRALEGALDAWAGTPEGWLALLIALDQFPRNLFRGSARAFAGDARARELARRGLERGDDARLPALARVFAYLPLEHAEDAELQAHSVALFEALAESQDAPAFEQFADYARRHRDVVERFGRFPHRNAALGRESTDAERAYLAEPGAGF